MVADVAGGQRIAAEFVFTGGMCVIRTGDNAADDRRVATRSDIKAAITGAYARRLVDALINAIDFLIAGAELAGRGASDRYEDIRTGLLLLAGVAADFLQAFDMQITAGAQGDLICGDNRASQMDVVLRSDIRLLSGLNVGVGPAQVIAIGVATSTAGRDRYANACIAVTDRRSDTDPVAAAFAGAGLRRGIGLRAQINGAFAVQAQVVTGTDLTACNVQFAVVATARLQVDITGTGDHRRRGYLQMLLAARFAFAAARHHADREAGGLARIFLNVAGRIGDGQRGGCSGQCLSATVGGVFPRLVQMIQCLRCIDDRIADGDRDTGLFERRTVRSVLGVDASDHINVGRLDLH